MTNYAMVPRKVNENYAMQQLSLRKAEESYAIFRAGLEK